MKSPFQTEKKCTQQTENGETALETAPLSRQAFRQLIRERRNQLSAEQQHQAGIELAEQCLSLELFTQAENIALYISVDGEINTHPLIEQLWARNKNVYVPVLHPFSAGHLLFLSYAEDTPLIYNKYGIAEPVLNQTKICPANQLDIIGTPLVGFDQFGQRLGMGGGYYDRTLSDWFHTGVGAVPIGLAHQCQYIEKLTVEEWDIPLPTVVTPDRVWRWS